MKSLMNRHLGSKKEQGDEGLKKKKKIGGAQRKAKGGQRE